MKLVVNNSSKIGRNDPCPCGSGLKYKKCCWETEETKNMNSSLAAQDRPDGFDPMAARMEMQSMMGQIGKIIQEKGMSIEEANKYFMGRNIDEIAIEARELRRSPQEQAEDMAYQAHSAKTPRQRILMAKKALELDPNCCEAYMILEQALAKDPVESIQYFDKAIAAAKKSLGEAFFKDNEGHFWGLHETRSFMRAQLYKVQSLWQVHRQSEAIEICWELLKFNTNDNQGVRYILFDFLLTDNRLIDIEKLLKKFKDEGSSHWEYNLALYYFKKFGPESEKTLKQIKIAVNSNPFIEKYLTGKLKAPKESPSSYSLGSKEEAICYLQDSAVPWANTSTAVEWLDSLKLEKNKKSPMKIKKSKADI